MAAGKGISTWSVCLLWPSPLETEPTAPGGGTYLTPAAICRNPIRWRRVLNPASTAASAFPAFLRSLDLPEPGELRRVARVYVWGRWLAVVTNGARDLQRDKLQTTGLEDHFDAIAVSGELGVAKPDPTIFRHTLDMLGVAPTRVWHVGDS